MEDEIEIPDPQLIPEQYEPPSSQNALMILRLIKNKIDSTLLPKDIKQHVMDMMAEFINNASMTNISINQVPEFLGDFDYICMTYTTFVNRRYRKELNYLLPSLRMILKMNLNKSKDGLYPKLVFEQRYRIEQHKETEEEKNRRWWGKTKPEKKQVSREVEYR